MIDVRAVLAMVVTENDFMTVLAIVVTAISRLITTDTQSARKL